MKNGNIDKFNWIVGNAPKENISELMKQISNQCTYLLEEVLETKEAAEDNDIQMIVDGISDIWYVAGYLQTMVESLGIDVKGAFNEVCGNNNLKFSTSKELVQRWKEEKDFPCYISEIVYNGETYYTLRRESDNKVMKHSEFPVVDLTPFIPKELLNA